MRVDVRVTSVYAWEGVMGDDIVVPLGLDKSSIKPQRSFLWGLFDPPQVRLARRIENLQKEIREIDTAISREYASRADLVVTYASLHRVYLLKERLKNLTKKLVRAQANFHAL